MQTTIDYGIDLGTTNSAIAVQRGLSSEVIGGGDGPLVPSAVHVGADAGVLVGAAAVERRVMDPGNVATEFKRLMGTSESILFPASGRRISPVELSAEVLKYLCRRAADHQGGVPIEATVITIPAMFQLPQCEATREASKLAGLVHAPLLQEPIAAAIASAGSADLREGYFLIYDLGGGTFDVSLVRSRAGRLQVLDHDGDNHLGGKDFDRLLVRRAADLVRSEGRLGEFRRTISALAPAFDLLKVEAERVRVALSQSEAADFRVERLAKAGDGDWVSVGFALTRGELEELIRPTILRTTALCRRMLQRNSLAPAELKRLVLVGGPTLTPCLPRILESELGIEAHHFVDPSQAVAIGAAIYACTQRIPRSPGSKGRSNRLELELSYEPMTNDPQPLVAGTLVGPLSSGEWQVRISSASGEASASRIPVRANGAFVTRVQLQPGALKVFVVEVYCDGVLVSGLGERFSILHGTLPPKPLLSQSVGVALADNSVRWYLRKGVVLPGRESVSHASTVGLLRGHSGTALHVPLIQGESERADRNTIVGVLQIRAENLSRHLPAGSEVVVTLTVDEHSTTTAEAYVPALGQTFRETLKFELETKSPEGIRQGVEGQRVRLAELEKLAAELEESADGDVDGRVRVIEELLEDSGADELNQADQILKELTGLIDSIEVKNQQPHLADQFAVTAEKVRSLLPGKDVERARQLEALSAEFRQAVDRADLRLAEAKFTAAQELEWSLLREQPWFWAQLFKQLSEAVRKGPNAKKAQLPIEEGKAALKCENRSGLRQTCLQLIQLIPQSEKAALPKAILSDLN
jgi:molecular chaperone DnaK